MITGSNSGLGKCTAVALAKKGTTLLVIVISGRGRLISPPTHSSTLCNEFTFH